MARQAKGKLVEGYLEKYKDIPSLTLAKMIARDCPMDFATIENARSMIRQYRGKSGVKAREANIAGGKHYKPVEAIDFAPFKLPESDSIDFTPYVLPRAQNNIGVISDLHIPNHRTEPIETAVKYLKEQNINTLIILGDLIDNTPFTRHDGKRPSASEVRDWFDKAEFILEWLRGCFPDAAIYFACGNHDYWYKRWMQSHAWQLDEDPYFSLEERLHLAEYKIKWIPREQYILAGKLALFHYDTD